MHPFIPRNEIADVIRTRSKVFWTVGLFTAFINLLMLVPSIYMLQVYDRVLPSRNEITLLMLTLIMLGMFGMMSLLEYVRSMVVIRIGSQLDMRLNTRIYTAAYEANLKNGSSDAGQMLSDLTHVRQFLTGSALFAFFDAPWFPIYLLVIFLFNPWLGLFALVGSLLLIALAVINEVVSKKPLADASRLSIMSGNLASTNLRNAEVIEALGMLPNLNELFAGSIAENIARFNELDSEKVIEAAMLAGVHELILRFPNGYDSVIGSGGARLSGGQKQRIGLARALYGDPSLIVLDEPNSNLDDAGERALNQAIAFLKQRNKTVILITHRTNLLAMTNKLLLLVNGNVNAYGPTQQVLQALANAQKAQVPPQAVRTVNSEPDEGDIPKTQIN